MNDIYVLIDIKLKEIICPPMRLPEIWANINGLNLLLKKKTFRPNLGRSSQFKFRRRLNNVPEGFGIPNDWISISKK